MINPLAMPSRVSPWRRPLSWAMAHLQKRNGHLLKSGSHLAKSCCPCPPTGPCGCGPENCTTNCTECAFSQASVGIHLASFNGCHSVGGGKWLRIAFSDYWPSFCLPNYTDCGWRLVYTSTSIAATCCFGTFQLYNDAGCSSFSANLQNFVFLVQLTKVSLTQWNLLVQISGSNLPGLSYVLINDTWSVASGNCDPTRTASNYYVIPCECLGSPNSPPSGLAPNRAQVIMSGVVGKTCLVHPTEGVPFYSSLLDEGNGSYDIPIPLHSRLGSGLCGMIGTDTYLARYTDSTCLTERDPSIPGQCPGTGIVFHIGISDCANCNPFFVKCQAAVEVGQAASAWMFFGTAYGTTQYDTFVMRNEAVYPSVTGYPGGIAHPVWVESRLGTLTVTPYRV